MLTIGNQLKAARGLADVDQITLAREAGISPNTLRAMEQRGTQGFTSSFAKVAAVQRALEARGIEFLDGGRPGVRLRDRAARPDASQIATGHVLPATEGAASEQAEE